MRRIIPALLLGMVLGVGALKAADSQVNTLQDTAVVVPVVGNEQAGQVAILQVTQPAHGTAWANTNGPGTNAELARLFQFAGTQLSNTVVQVGDTNLYPRRTQSDGSWYAYGIGSYNWVSGFFPGALWYLYEHTGDGRYRGWAESWTAGIAPMQYVTTADDVSFMVNTSFGAGYRLTGNPAYLPVMLQGAQSIVAARYNPVVGCIGEPWEGPGTFSAWLDTMMNLELLFRAAALGGDRSLYDKAVSHAEKTMLNQIRADGSTYHEAVYDAATGAIVDKVTFAGAANESTWARGHAWAIYGFTMVYRETGDTRFLNAAQRVADYYLANVPADYVPYWDFQAPGIPDAPRDSSAAAITLSALVDLSRMATNLQDSARYWLGARHILSSLGSTNYLAQGTPSRGILLHGTGEPPHFPSPEVDVSLIYGDYYFVEALHRYENMYRRSSITYVPSPGFQGTDSFTYQVADSAGNCSTAVVSVVVEPAVPNSFTVQIAQAPGAAGPDLRFPTTAGRLYQLEYTDELPGPWTVLQSSLAGSGFPLTLTDTNPAGQRFYRVGTSTPPKRPQTISLPAASGTVAEPFVLTNGTVYQSIETTDVTTGGRAVYSFSLTSTQSVVIQATVNAPQDDANSFFLNIDAEPQDPGMIWDIPLTAGFESRLVSWRGSGTYTNNQFVPKVFNLLPGPHQLILRGREANTVLQQLEVLPYP